MTEYGKAIKKRLIDIDKPQKWLIDKVAEKTGLYFDSAYLAKIVSGKKSSPKIIAAINSALKLDGEAKEV